MSSSSDGGSSSLRSISIFQCIHQTFEAIFIVYFFIKFIRSKPGSSRANISRVQPAPHRERDPNPNPNPNPNTSVVIPPLVSPSAAAVSAARKPAAGAGAGGAVTSTVNAAVAPHPVPSGPVSSGGSRSLLQSRIWLCKMGLGLCSSIAASFIFAQWWQIFDGSFDARTVAAPERLFDYCVVSWKTATIFYGGAKACVYGFLLMVAELVADPTTRYSSSFFCPIAQQQTSLHLQLYYQFRFLLYPITLEKFILSSTLGVFPFGCIAAFWITGDISSGLCLIELPIELALVMMGLDMGLSAGYLTLFLKRLGAVRRAWIKMQTHSTNRKQHRGARDGHSVNLLTSVNRSENVTAAKGPLTAVVSGTGTVTALAVPILIVPSRQANPSVSLPSPVPLLPSSSVNCSSSFPPSSSAAVDSSRVAPIVSSSEITAEEGKTNRRVRKVLSGNWMVPNVTESEFEGSAILSGESEANDVVAQYSQQHHHQQQQSQKPSSPSSRYLPLSSTNVVSDGKQPKRPSLGHVRVSSNGLPANSTQQQPPDHSTATLSPTTGKVQMKPRLQTYVSSPSSAATAHAASSPTATVAATPTASAAADRDKQDVYYRLMRRHFLLTLVMAASTSTAMLLLVLGNVYDSRTVRSINFPGADLVISMAAIAFTTSVGKHNDKGKNNTRANNNSGGLPLKRLKPRQ